MMAIFTSQDRDATLGRVLELLEADSRIEAAVLTGSLGSQRMDRWSDLDVASVIGAGESSEQVTDDWVSVVYREWPVAHHYETAFGSTLVRGFLLETALVIDLAFTPSADLSIWAPVRVAFDRTGMATRAAQSPEAWSPTPDWRGESGFAWHDVLRACTAANRGRLWQSLYFLQRVRNRTLGLASERHGLEADEFKHVDDLPSNERDPLLPSLVSELSPSSLLGAVEVATHAFIDELTRGDPALANRLAQPLLSFVQASREEGVAHGTR